jgi:two-component system OmpR family response regulator
MRCLLIEDDQAAAQLIQDGLQREGFSVTACHDGASGLSKVNEAGWDVVVLDRMLPGALDGLDILSTMRGRGDATPVLILSALGSLNERVRGLRDGKSTRARAAYFVTSSRLFCSRGNISCWSIWFATRAKSSREKCC